MNHLETFLYDLRYARRMLTKSPRFTVAAVLTLAIGVGASSAIFSVIDAVLLRALPYPQPERLVRLYNTMSSSQLDNSSWKDIADWQAQTNTFEQIEGFGLIDKRFSENNEHILASYATEGFFRMFGVSPRLGRAFTAEDYGQNWNKSVALAERFWKNQLGGDPGIVGQTIIIDGNSVTVVGIIPDRFDSIAGQVQVWLPFNSRWSRDARFLRAIGRLNSNLSIADAGTELNEIAGRLEQLYPRSNFELGIKLVPLDKTIIGDVRMMLWILLGAVGLVLLIASASVANLLLTKAVARGQEMAIRSAMGASRSRLIAQLLTESLLLCSLGGGLAFLLAIVAIKFLIKFSPGYIPRLEEIRLDGRIIGFTILLSLATTIIFSLVPVLRVWGKNFNALLNEAGRSGSGSARQSRARNVLVIAELALSLILMIGCGLLIRSFYVLRNVNPGFNQENVMTARLLVPGAKYQSFGSLKAFTDEILARLESSTTWESFALCDQLPLDASGSSLWAQASPQGGSDHIVAQRRQVSPTYFRTMEIPLIGGREFNQFDGPTNGHMELIISQSLAQRFWPGESAVGKVINFNAETFPVCGVVGDVKRVGLDNPEDMAVYFSVAVPVRAVLRSAGYHANAAEEIKSLLQSVDKDLIVYDIRSMDQVVDNTLSERRFVLFLLALFAGLALSVSAIGIYGVISYWVMQRMREIGVRMALGASPTDVLWLVVRQGSQLVGIGVVFGLIGAFCLTHLMRTLLFNVSPTDPLVFFTVSLFLVLVALLASYLPARRATRINPALVLRCE